MHTTEHNLSNARWRKSTYSDNEGGSCIEVADHYPGIVQVRDSKDSQGPALIFSAAAWAAFVADVKDRT